MTSQEKWDRRFLGLAEHVSQWSKDPSTKVGAVITTYDHKVVSLGFNGFPQGMGDDPERYNNREEKYSRIVHAEMNAILFAEPSQLINRVLYTYPFLPCDRCAVLIAQTQIFRVVSYEPTEELKARWGAALERTRSYFGETTIDFVEYSRYPNEETIDVGPVSLSIQQDWTQKNWKSYSRELPKNADVKIR